MFLWLNKLGKTLHQSFFAAGFLRAFTTLPCTTGAAFHERIGSPNSFPWNNLNKLGFQARFRKQCFCRLTAKVYGLSFFKHRVSPRLGTMPGPPRILLISCRRALPTRLHSSTVPDKLWPLRVQEGLYLLYPGPRARTDAIKTPVESMAGDSH